MCVTESIYRIKTLTKQKENAEERARLAEEMVHTKSQTYKVKRWKFNNHDIFFDTQKLMDEHSELQLEFITHDSKLKELQIDNDCLVSVGIHTAP